MYVVLTLLSLLPLLVAGQMLRIHLGEGDVLRAQGEKQASSFVPIPAMRGNILDREGRTLVVNTARYDLALDPKVEGFDAQASTFFEKLSRLTGTPASTLRRRVARRSSPRYVLLLRDISEPQKEAVESWDVPGVLLTPKFARRYNYGRVAAHVLGHVDTDGTGLAGIELQYDRYLDGVPGRRAVRYDRRRHEKAYVGGRVVEPKHGETVVLTIDLIRQTILEEELARGLEESGAQWATAIAMDPHTGAILAMANAPTYDPNRAAAYATDARRNRAITDRYEPGSTFKLVSAVAAVEQGVVALDDSVETGAGWAVFGGRTMRDTHGYGTLSYADVLAKSSNVGVAKVASRLDPGVFYQYARNLGFGQPTWIDLPGEVGGLLKKPADWSGTSLTSMSIGYEVDVTPLQILTAYSAFANGGLLVQPHIVAERRAVTGETLWRAQPDSVRRAFEARTARTLLPAFERVVADGGTAEQARVEGLRVAGKTGTAQKAVGGRYQRAYRASFVGFFPADDPQVALVVVMDQPTSSIYGGSVAAPVFRRVAERWLGTFPKIARRVAPEAEAPEAAPPVVPDVVGEPPAVAARQLRAAGYAVALDPEAPALQTVAAQKPAPGTDARPGTRARLDFAADSAAVMPDLEGLSARAAMFWLASRGVEVQVDGHGAVRKQWPAAGTALPQRARLQCR